MSNGFGMTQKKQRVNNFKKHFSFEYQHRAYGTNISRVYVSIISLPDGKNFVLMRNTGDGVSVSSISEKVATAILYRFGLDPERTVWGEYYAEYNRNIEIVKYTWHPERQKFLYPVFESAPEWLSKYVFEMLKKPVTYSLN